jgi:hypothetical protein
MISDAKINNSKPMLKPKYKTEIFNIVNKYGRVKQPDSDDNDDNYLKDEFQITISKKNHEIKVLNNDEKSIITIPNNLIIEKWNIKNEINKTKFNAFLFKIKPKMFDDLDDPIYIMIGSGHIRIFRPNKDDKIIGLFSTTSGNNSDGEAEIITIALSEKYLYFQVFGKYLSYDCVDKAYKKNIKKDLSCFQEKGFSEEFISDINNWSIKNIYNNNYEWGFFNTPIYRTYEIKSFEYTIIELFSLKKYNNNYINNLFFY